MRCEPGIAFVTVVSKCSLEAENLFHGLCLDYMQAQSTGFYSTNHYIYGTKPAFAWILLLKRGLAKVQVQTGIPWWVNGRATGGVNHEELY